MSFAIKYLLEERFADGVTFNDENSFFSKEIQKIGKRFHISTECVEFSSFYRDIEVIEEKNSICLLWDNALFDFISNLIFCLSTDDNDFIKIYYRRFLELCLLENAIKDNSPFKKGFLVSHLSECGSNFSRVAIRPTNDPELYDSLIIAIKLFTFFHELSHLITNYGDEKEIHNRNVQEIYKMMTAPVLTEFKEKDREKRNDFYASVSREIRPDISVEEYQELISQYLSKESTRVELECDINAILMLVATSSHDESSLSALYLSVLLQYKIMATISNVKALVNSKDYGFNQTNYFEQRIRIDFRADALMLIIYKECFKENMAKFEQFEAYFNENCRYIVDKFESNRLPIEQYYFGEEYLKHISNLADSFDTLLKDDTKAYLRLLGWL